MPGGDWRGIAPVRGTIARAFLPVNSKNALALGESFRHGRPMTEEQIIATIDDAAARERVQPSTICRWAGVSSNTYKRLVAGHSCSVRNAQKLLAWIEAQKKGAA
jgi:hypothetical protein